MLPSIGPCCVMTKRYEVGSPPAAGEAVTPQPARSPTRTLACIRHHLDDQTFASRYGEIVGGEERVLRDTGATDCERLRRYELPVIGRGVFTTLTGALPAAVAWPWPRLPNASKNRIAMTTAETPAETALICIGFLHCPEAGSSQHGSRFAVS